MVGLIVGTTSARGVRVPVAGRDGSNSMKRLKTRQKRRSGEASDRLSESGIAADRGFVAIVVLIAVIAIWVLVMPVVPEIASTTLRRFHLRTGSFAGWAVQFPIPAMYNFANTYQVRKWPEGAMEGLQVMIDDDEAIIQARYVNHFPSRVITFGRQRHDFLSPKEDRWYKLESSYRRLELVSYVKLNYDQDSGYTYVRTHSDGKRLRSGGDE